MKKRASSIVFFSLLCTLSSAQEFPFKQQASAENLKQTLSFLASDSLKGRATRSKEQEVAAYYIANKFKQYGLTGASANNENTYFDPFFLISSNFPSNRKLVVKETGEELSDLKDLIIASGKSINDQLLTPFLGSSETLKGKEYTKVVVASSFEEAIARIEKFIAENNDIKSYMLILPVKKMIEYNRARLSLTSLHPAFVNNMGDTLTVSRQGESLPLSSNIYYANVLGFIYKHPNITLTISDNFLLKKLFESSTLDKLDNISNTTIGNSIKVAGTILPDKLNSDRVANVVARIEGSNPNEEAIVVSAHFDHIGIKKMAEKTEYADSICNGADDNASGTSAILEVARLFSEAKAKGVQPKRSVVFVAFTAEELGLLGSQYMANHSFIPLDKIKAVVNLDMVGRTDEKNRDEDMYAYVLPFGDTIALKNCMNISAKKANLDIWKEFGDMERMLWSSGTDHASFVDKNVSAITITTGMHNDYHKPSDQVEKINFNRLAKIATFTYFTVWELANM